MARVIGSLFFHSIEASDGLSTQHEPFEPLEQLELLEQQLEQQQQRAALAYVHAFNVTGGT